ncbi:hypothetical protein C8J56DRAFT_337792 [Mycena floridula]|nr:hypothetical protein C8J56DRAFT_337792 [Mycena floridula]
MVAGGIAADTTAILSLALECGLYGISVVLFVHTILVLAKDHKTRPVNRTMTVLACLFFVLSTWHAIVDVVRAKEGFVNERERFKGGPSAYFADVTQPIFVIRSTLYASQTLLGDAVVIYRCYVVWQSFYVALFPLILWCGCAGVAMALLDAVARANPSSIFILSKLIDTFFATTLSCNILGTGLLAYRIWKINAATAEFRIGNSLLPVARVVADSGALYSVTLLVALFTFVSGSNSQFLLVDLLMPIIAIAFYAIIIRVSLARQASKTGSAGSGVQQSYNLAPFQVHIPETQFTADPCDHENDDRTRSI